MSADERYVAPRAEVADVDRDTAGMQSVDLLSTKGRIGRMRYVAYVALAYLALVAAVALLAAMTGVSGSSLVGLATDVLNAAGLLFWLLFVLWLSIQRSHDMDWSGWTVVLALIPLVALIWMFKPGTARRNRFGAPPPPNPLWIKILAWTFPAMLAIGALVVWMIPAYQEQEHVQRAKAAQIVKPDRVQHRRGRQRTSVDLPNRLSISSTATSAVRLRTSSAGLSSTTSSELSRPVSAIISMHSCISR